MANSKHLELNDSFELEDIMASFSQTEYVSLTVMFLFVGFISLVGNIATIILFCKNKTLWKKFYATLISLTVSDVIGGCISLNTGFKLVAGEDVFKDANSLISLWLLMFPSFTSQCHMVLMSVERYLAVVHPLVHMKYYTKKSAAVSVGVTWVASVLLTFLTTIISAVKFGSRGEVNVVNIATSKLNSITVSLVDLIIYLFNCIFIVSLYTHIIYRIKNVKSSQALCSQEVVAPLAKKQKCVLMTCSLIGYFILTWTPFVVSKVFAVMTNDLDVYKLVPYFAILGYTNFANNHVIFVALNPTIWEIFKKSLCCFKNTKCITSAVSR